MEESVVIRSGYTEVTARKTSLDLHSKHVYATEVDGDFEKSKKATDKNGAPRQVRGSPEIPNRFEKTLFTPCTITLSS